MAAFVSTFLAWAATWKGIATIASIAYQIVQSRKMRKAAQDAAEARKGFELVVDGAVVTLPIVYGRALVGGARVFSVTSDSFKHAESNSDKLFNIGPPGAPERTETTVDDDGNETTVTIPAVPPGLLNRDLEGSKNEYLLFEQALCQGPINKVHDLIVNGSMSIDDPSLTSYVSGSGTVAPKAALRVECHTGNGKTADAMISANFPQRISAEFPNVAYLAACFRLDRDDPQFNGVPDIQAVVEGRKVRKVTSGGTLSATYEYSNNPAWCLLDYLLDKTCGKALDESELDLNSFKAAAEVCEKIVLTNATVGGKIWQPTDGSRSVHNRDLPLYECNMLVDTGKPVRENVEAILSTMGDARLVWSQGKYKLLLQYPETNAQIELSAVLTDADLIHDDKIDIAWPTSSERLNHAIVRFHNEANDFKEDSVSWPPKKSGVYYKGIGGRFYPEARGTWENDLSGALLNKYGVWSGVTDNTILEWKFLVRKTGTHTLRYTVDDNGTLSVNGSQLSAPTFGEIKTFTFTAAKNDIIAIAATAENTGGPKAFAAECLDLDSRAIWTTRSQAYEDFIRVDQTSDVYDEMLLEDSGLQLETDFFLDGVTDYYHALAKAEELVRTSRSAFTVAFKYLMKDKFFEPGDMIRLDSDLLNLHNVYLRVNEVKVADALSCEIKASRFDYTQLAWNVDDNTYLRPPNPYGGQLRAPAWVVYEDAQDLLQASSGKVTWSDVSDTRVVGYVVYVHRQGDYDTEHFPIYNEIGRAPKSPFVLPQLAFKDARFGVRAYAANGKMSAMTLSTTSGLVVGKTPPTPVLVECVSDENKPKISLKWTIPTKRDDDSNYDDHLLTTIWRQIDLAPAIKIGESAGDTFVDLDEQYGICSYYVKLVSNKGKSSAASNTLSAEFTHNGGVGGGEPPPAPYDLTAENGLDFVRLAWSVPNYTQGGGHAFSVVYGVEKTGESDPPFEAARPIARTGVNEFWHTIGLAKTWRYWVKTESKGGVLSLAAAGPVYGQTGLVRGVDLAPDLREAISILETGIGNQNFIPGLEAVAFYTGPSLPTEIYKNATYLSWQGRLYKWNGTAYTAVVNTVDLVGQIVAEQVAQGAITTAAFAQGIEPIGMPSGNSLPTTKSTETIFFKGKLYKWNGTAYTPVVNTVDLVGQIVSEQVAQGAITTAAFAQGIEPIGMPSGPSLPTTKSTQTIFFNGKLYKWNGTAYVGAVSAPELTGQIVSTQITDDAITTPKIAANAVTAGEIAANAITADKIAANSIVAGKIAAGAISANEIAAGQVSATHLAAGSITADKIAANAVTAGKIAADSITGDKIAANAITADKIAANSITAGKIATGAINAAQIAAGQISTTHLAAGIITSDKIAANAVTAGKIAADSITGDKIAANSITGDKIVANSITSGLIATGAIAADKLAAGAIAAGSAAIAAAAIDTAHIMDAAISSAKIKDLSVDTLKIAGEAVTRAAFYSMSWYATLNGDAEFQIASQDIYIPPEAYPAKLIIHATTPLYPYTSTSVSAAMRIRVDGTLLTEIATTSDGNGTSLAASCAATYLAGGWHTVAVSLTELAPWYGEKPLAGALSLTIIGALR